MRIAVDAIPLVRSRTTGIQNHARGLCRAMTDLGGEHEFVAVHEKSQEHGADFDDSFIASLGPRWRRLAVWSPGPTANLARRLWQGWALPRALRRNQCDVYYSATTRGPTGGSVPGFITIHDLAQEVAGKVAAPPPEVVQLARCSRGIFAVSEATGIDVHRLLTVPGRNITIVYNGPALGIAPADLLSQRRLCQGLQLVQGRFLLCVGDENWRRRYDLLWEAMGSLWSARKLDDVRVVFVGRQEWRQTRLFEQVHESKLKSRAVFLSNVGEADLSILYSSALATILPTEAEGFGMPAVEAMTCNCPLLCSDIPVLHEVAGPAAKYFALSAEQIAAAVQLLAGDEPLRRELIRLGRQQAARYSWRSSAQRVLDTFARCLEAPTRK